VSQKQQATSRIGGKLVIGLCNATDGSADLTLSLVLADGTVAWTSPETTLINGESLNLSEVAMTLSDLFLYLESGLTPGERRDELGK
jgi:hypothetical protein